MAANPKNVIFVGRTVSLVDVKRKETKIRASKKTTLITVK